VGQGGSGAGPARLIVLAGPTAVGKSELALRLAERFDGEIVNGDALQLYRGMDIGTAKLPPAERRGIPHHVLDVLDVVETATVAQYQGLARTAVETILAAHRTPILVGGSGLYLQSVVDELTFPGSDPGLRAHYEELLAVRGPASLHAELAAADPTAAAAINPGNGRRIVRALEVIALTGRPFSATMPTTGKFRYDASWFCLDRDTAELDERIGLRVTQMVDEGLLDEVRELERHGLRRGVTASRALGYQQMLAVLDGMLSLAEAVAQTAAGTRRYVRRQRSWFRRDRRQVWLRADDPDVFGRIVTESTRASSWAADRPG
jgi:tRNA dimethylallyltransferase